MNQKKRQTNKQELITVFSFHFSFQTAVEKKAQCFDDFLFNKACSLIAFKRYPAYFLSSCAKPNISDKINLHQGLRVKAKSNTITSHNARGQLHVTARFTTVI